MGQKINSNSNVGHKKIKSHTFESILQVSNKNQVIPIVYSDRLQSTKHKLVLAGDLGATKMNLALYKINGNDIEAISHQRQYYCRDYNSLKEIVEDFGREHDEKPDSICVGVAGAVIDNKAGIVNLGWEVDGKK